MAVFVGIDILLAVRLSNKNFGHISDDRISQAASGVSSSYDALLDLFESLSSFLKRLEVYTSIPPTPIMTDIIVKIIVELLSVLALATKQIKQGRFSKYITRFNCLPLKFPQRSSQKHYLERAMSRLFSRGWTG
jgi:hypothetical protein